MENTKPELDAITNGSESVEATTPADTQATADASKPEPTPERPATLDDAIKAAYEKHTAKPEDEPTEKKAALPEIEKPVEAPKQTDAIGRELEPIKAPAGWTPELREKWRVMDPTVQKFIIDREHDITRKLNETA